MKKKILTALLILVALLPLRVLYILSDMAAFVLDRVLHYRRDVITENLSTSFPEKSPEEIKRIKRLFYRHLTDVMVETVKLFHISDRQLMRRVKILNYEIVNAAVESGCSAVIFLGHYGNWEWVQEISRYVTKDAFRGDIYRAAYDKTWDEIFLQLRSRWNLHQIEHDAAFRTLLRISMEGRKWVIGFISDQRPFSFNWSNFTTFLNHNTAFTAGAEEIGRRAGAAFFYLDIEQPKRGYYTMTFRQLEPAEGDMKYPVTVSFYRELEKSIRRNPALWLWSHNRWAWQSTIAPNS